MTDLASPFSPGLEGIVAAQTAISSVDGQKGELVMRGFAVEDLAPHATFEETVFLLWYDALPDAGTLDRFRAELVARRVLYTALVLHGIEFPTALFTPAFAAGRVAGWTAHCLEQIAFNRLFRPQSMYIGARNRRWVPAGERSPAST